MYKKTDVISCIIAKKEKLILRNKKLVSREIGNGKEKLTTEKNVENYKQLPISEWNQCTHTQRSISLSLFLPLPSSLPLSLALFSSFLLSISRCGRQQCRLCVCENLVRLNAWQLEIAIEVGNCLSSSRCVCVCVCATTPSICLRKNSNISPAV